MFKLYYSAFDGEVHFHLTKKAAETRIKREDWQWGACVGKVEFTVSGRKLLFKHTAPIWREVPTARS